MIPNRQSSTPVKYNLKMKDITVQSPYPPSLKNRNVILTKEGVGSDYPVDLAQHHIISRVMLRDFYNKLIEKGDVKKFRRFFSALRENIPEYYRESREGNSNSREDITRAQEFIDNLMEGSIIHSNNNEAASCTDIKDPFLTCLLWLPGNIFIGPDAKNRSDDPETGFEENARTIIGEKNFKNIKKIKNLMDSYIRGDLTSLGFFEAQLIKLVRKSKPYPLRAKQWIISHGKYKIAVQDFTPCKTRSKRAASGRMLCIDLNDMFRLSEEAERDVYTEEGKKTFQEILQHLNEGKHNLNASLVIIYRILADKWQRLRFLEETEEVLYNFLGELASIWIRALQDESIPFKNIDLSSVYDSLLKLRNFNDRWKIEDPKLPNLILELANKAQTYTKFGSQDIANTLNALSKWDLSSDPKWKDHYKPLILELAKMGIKISDQFNAQDIANTLNALSKWDLSSDPEWKDHYKPLILELAKMGIKISDQFNAQDIANTLNALSKWGLLSDLNWKDHYKPLILELAKMGIKISDQFNAQDIANTLNALSKWGLSSDLNWKDHYKPLILELAKKREEILSQFNAQDIANTLNALSKWDLLSDFNWENHYRPLILELAKREKEVLSQFSAQDIANTLNALSKLDLLSCLNWESYRPLIVSLAEKGERISNQFNAQDIVNTLSALSKWDLSSDPKWKDHYEPLILKLVERGMEISDQFNAQDVANTLNALSKWDLSSDLNWKDHYRPLILKLVQRGIEISNQFNAQDVVNILSATSKLDLLSDLYFSTYHKLLILRIIKKRKKSDLVYYLDQFNAQDIANALNTLSKWDLLSDPDWEERYKPLILELVKEGIKISDQFNAQDIANTLNALSKWGLSSDLNWKDHYKPLILELAKMGIKISDQFNAQDIANTLNALSKWGLSSDLNWKDHYKPLILELAKMGIKISDQFNAQDIANTLNALSKWDLLSGLNWKSYRPLIVSLAEKGERISNQFNAQDVANTLNALSKWNLLSDFYWKKHYKSLIVKLIEREMRVAYQFSAQDITNTLNALSKLDPLFSHKFKKNNRFIIIDLVERQVEISNQFSTQDITNTLNVLLKWDLLSDLDRKDHYKSRILRLIKKRKKSDLVYYLDQFSAQDIANALNALSKWDLLSDFNWKDHYKPLILELAKMGIKISDQFSAQDIANALNALSKWDLLSDFNWKDHYKPLILELAKMGIKISDQFNAQDIANTLNALSKWGLSSDLNWKDHYKPLILKLAKMGIKISDQFNAQDIANTLNALSKWDLLSDLNWKDHYKPLILKLTKRGEEILSQFNAQDVANTLNALSKWDLLSDPHLDRYHYNFLIFSLAKMGIKISDQFNAQDIANILNALSKWDLSSDPNWKGHYESLILKLVERGMEISDQFNAQDITNTLNVLLKLDSSSDPDLEKHCNLLIFELKKRRDEPELNIDDEMAVELKEFKSKIGNEVLTRHEKIKGTTTHDVNKSDVLSNALQSLQLNEVSLLMSQESKMSTKLEKKTYYNTLIDIGALVYDHKNHVHRDRLEAIESRIFDNPLLSVGHDLYYLSKNEDNIVDQDKLYSDQIKNKVSSYSYIESGSRLDAIYSELSDTDIKDYFSDSNVEGVYTEIEAYNKEVMTIHSIQVSADEVYVNVKDNNGNYQKVVIGDVASIQNTENYILDEEISEIKFKTDNDKEYVITQEGEDVKHCLNIPGGYKVKVDDVISSLTKNKKEVIRNELNNLGLSASVKEIEEIGNAEITDQGYSNAMNEIRQSFLQKGIGEDTFDRFRNRFDSLGEKIFEEYINDVEKKLEGHGIEFNRNKFDSARVKGAKGGKLFFFMAIYDLFDSILDTSTLGRHDNDALKKIFGINGVLDALDDVRESLSTQHMRPDGSKGVRLLGRKITNKIPDVIRKGFVKIISNPVVKSITFVTVAYQFIYSISEIAKGNHHPLNYYWTTSSGVKLASMSIRPVMGFSFAIKGINITPKILRRLSIASKTLGKLSKVIGVVDMLISIGTSIHERMEYTRAIAEQVPLLPGKEQADVFFAEWRKFFTGRDLGKEYEEVIRIKGHLNDVKKKAVEVLVGSDVAAVVWYISSIKERYNEITIHREGMYSQAMKVHYTVECEPEKEYKNVSFNSGAGTISNSYVAYHNLSLLNIPKALKMKPYILGMSGDVGAFRSNMGCFDKFNEEEVYIIDTNARHVFHLTRFEYENLDLRVVDAPLKYTKKEPQCGAVINLIYPRRKSSACNIAKLRRECTQEFVLSDEPFVLADIKKSRSSPILYLLGPNQLIAAKDYPAIMYVPKGEIDYIGSKYHDNTFIINHDTRGNISGGIVNNIIVMNYDTPSLSVELNKGIVEMGESKIHLLNVYDYVSHSTDNQSIITDCKTRYIDAGEGGGYNSIQSHDVDCQDNDYEVRKVNKRDTHLRSTKQTSFIVDKSSGDGAGINSGNLGSKKNLDVILFEGNDIRLLRINEHQAYYNLELLADDEKSKVASIKVGDFEKLMIQAKKAGITEVVTIQNKSLSDLIKDMKYQKLNHSGIDVGSKIMEDSKKISKAVIIANIIDSEGPTAYKVAKDIINNNNLGVPISLVQAKKIVGNVVYEEIIGGIYTDEIAADFSCENIHCKKVITIEMNSYSSDYVVKFPQTYKRSHSVDFTLRIITAPYASTSDKVIDLTGCDIDPKNIKCKVNCENANEIVLSSHINQGSFQIVLDNYLRGPKYQQVAFQFNKGGRFYKVNSANLKFEPARAGVDPDGENKVGSSLRERMFDAIDQDNMDEVEDLAKSIDIERLTSFDKGCASIEYQDIRGRSLLHLAAQEGKLSMVKFFINQAVSVMDIDKYGNIPFYYAAKNGHTEVVNSLWDKAVGVQREMLEANDYEAFKLAAKNGHTEVVNSLWDKAVGVQREMLGADRYEAFKLAAKNGHTEVVNSLWDKAVGVQREMLEANDYEAFKLAARNGHTKVVNSLWDKAVGVQCEMLGADRYEAFKLAARNGHTKVVNSLWDKAVGVQCEMLGADRYEAFKLAAENGHTEVVNSLWDEAESLGVQREMLKANNYEAFTFAAENGHTEVVNFLLNKTSLSEVQREMLKADSYEAFRFAAKNGHTEVVNSLWDKAVGVQREMLKAGGYRAFNLAAGNGYTKAVNFLWEEAVSLKMEYFMLEAGIIKYEAFKLAAENGHTEVVNSLWDKVKSGVRYKMLRDSGYHVFKLAAENGHIKVVDSLWKKAESFKVQHEMLEFWHHLAFKLAAENGHDKILDFLWGKANSSGVQYSMLMTGCYKPFRFAVKGGYDEVIDSLWTKAKQLGIQLAMLRDNDYYAFKLAAENGHTEVVNSLWDEAESLGVQREMLKANNYEAFIFAAENGHTEVVNFLLNKTSLSEVQREMLKSDSYEAFRFAAKNGHTEVVNSLWDKAVGVQREMLKANNYEAFVLVAKNGHDKILDFLWNKTSLSEIQHEMLKAGGYRAFNLAAKNDHTEVADSLWDKAGSLEVQREMLKTGDYKALALIITGREGVYFLKRFRSAISVDKESIIYSPHISGILIQKWKECLEAVAHRENEEMFKWVWQTFILPLRLEKKQEISEFYQEFKQNSTEAGGSPKRAEESVQEKKKTTQRKRRHHHGDYNRHHGHLSRKPLAIDLSNQHEVVASSSARPSSWINDLFSWVKDSIGGLFSSRAALPEETLNTTSSISQIDAPIDVNGTIMLLDLLIRKVTGQKYISTADQPISPLEAQSYALNITKGFERLLNETATKSGISVKNLSFDPVVVQSAIVRQIVSEKFSEISKTLYSFAKEACPELKQTDKFLVHLRSQLEGEKETVLLQQKIEKPSEVLDQQVSRKVELPKRPNTFLNGTSVVKGISSVLER
ncbi:ankyrin repeat domain-containing protein [Wolbachia endosymbiont of Armadillidium arcangelii]|uniref:Ankyrin repeat domain-containing protein n=1 Tax=Wolbachia endosymbiont of Armadillidium arcangelii TaxID=3158571 RepID=A0AAU7Q2A7_9RICK